MRAWVSELDTAILRDRPELAELPGRFWFGIDDGRGDVSGLGADVGAHVLPAMLRRCCWPGATPACGCQRRDAVDDAAAVAARFVGIRGEGLADKRIGRSADAC